MTPDRIILALFAITIIWLTVYNVRTLLLPDAITIPGIVAGLLLAIFFPGLHGQTELVPAAVAAFQGLLLGAFVVYAILLASKVLFGTLTIQLPTSSKVVFTETSLVLPEREMLYEQLFYRKFDLVRLTAVSVDLHLAEGNALPTQSFTNVPVSLNPCVLQVGGVSFDSSQVVRLEAITDRVFIPREVVGFGLVKLAALVGVFLGWPGILFGVGCQCIVLTLCFLLSLGIPQTRGQSIEAATPLCIASIVWIVFRPQFVLAGSIVVALGMISSIAIALWRSRMEQ